MRRKDLGPEEIRVLGCLIEKQRTTPDAYPLTLNALRLACNQSTNRDPVLDLDDSAVRAAAERLARRRLARFASGHGSRAAKYRHLLSEELGLESHELAVLGVLMLRGPQTPGELKGRAERLHPFPDLGTVHDALARLGDREYVRRLERRPGQKEERYEHRLAEDFESDGAAPAEPTPRPPPSREVASEDRLTRLEREVVELRAALEDLKRALSSGRDG